MLETGVIDAEEMQAALAEPIVSRIHGAQVKLTAPWVAEMARQAMLERFGAEAYTRGYAVITSIDSRLQPLAQAAVLSGLRRYDERHGYRGPLARLGEVPADTGSVAALLDGYPEPAGLQAGLVLALDDEGADVLVRGAGTVRVPFAGMRWARPFIDDDRRGPAPESSADVLAPGDVVLLRPEADTWALSQVPEAQGAVVAVDPHDGAIVALSGGLDFEFSKFNRATQARRQPGSAFKPFIYSAGLERGLTAATIILDAPVVYDDPGLEDTWRPQNYTGRFYGPMRLREALVQSRNLVSIRLLEQVGIDFTVDHVSRFGFAPETMPRNLTLALGSGAVTPLQLAAGYAAFANGGFRIEPYFIDRIYGPDQELLYQAQPLWACPDCALPDSEEADAAAPPQTTGQGEPAGDEMLAPIELEQPPRAVDARNAWIIGDMLADVVQRGTGNRARTIGRSDLAGKTGTTNDGRDTWFAGYNGDLVATAWIGFDQERSLGRGETGGSTALPMWIDFMGPALEGSPPSRLEQPPGLVSVRISPDTGRLARAGDPGAIFETFRVGNAPTAPDPGEERFPEESRDDDEPLF
jgi:penicillin-binding protein 1A